MLLFSLLGRLAKKVFWFGFFLFLFLLFKTRVVRTWQAGDRYLVRHCWVLRSTNKVLYAAAYLGLDQYQLVTYFCDYSPVNLEERNSIGKALDLGQQNVKL